MKYIYTTIVALFFIGALCAQKANISDTTYKTWTQVFNGNISPNGKYADYQIRTTLYSQRTLVLTATDKSWEKRIVGAQTPVYSGNGKDAYVIINRRLLKIRLATDQMDTVASCDRFELLKFKKREYLVYNTGASNSLIVRVVDGQKVFSFDGAQEYWKDEKSGTLVIKQKTEGKRTEVLLLLNLQNGRQQTFFKGANVSNLIFDNAGKSLAFITSAADNKNIWYYSLGMDQAKSLLNDTALQNGLRITTTDFWKFSINNDRLLFTFDEQLLPYKKDPQAPDVWSYEDKIVYQKFKLRNFQLSGLAYGKNLSSIDLVSGKLNRLTKPGEAVIRGIKMVGDWVMIESVGLETLLNCKGTKSYYLLNTANKSRKIIKLNADKGFWNIHISPDEKFVIYFDADDKNWICYHIVSQKSKPFAESIMNQLYFYQENIRSQNEVPLEVLCWVDGTDHIMMQGTHDLWEVSVTNQIEPINLTSNRVAGELVFTLAKRPQDGIMKANENLYVYSQDLDTKINAFYRLNLKRGEFTQLHSGSFYWATLYNEIGGANLQKAENEEAFLFVENRADQSRNYLFGTDFKHIVKLSDNHPEKAYNWMTSELLTYKDEQGNTCQGILYKPENFDSQKKYPVIFTIYQEQSYSLNNHISPEWFGSGINIPYLVSNGYLVCKPDVYIAKGKIGEYALVSVLAAVDYLSKCSWVDSNKLGLTGHSLGGFETNYIVTRTNRFAAAMASSSVSSMINTYNDLWGDGDDKHAFSIRSAPSMGRAMEDFTEAYIENSPILHTKSINTPLLLFHNDADGASPFYHSTQLFVQLRSMGKKVWLVSYANEGHGVLNPLNQLDYNSKVTSFFDYYLRDKPKPNWMSKHITF